MSPEYIAALRASAGPAQGFQGEPLAKFVNGKMVLASPKQAAPQPQKGKGGFLSSIISEAGGAGGAALGGAIGTALIPIPGLGTLIGAGIGGALGGTGGRLAENKIRDNKYNLGSALKEGALSGVLGAGGEAFQLAKAGKAITGSKSLLRPIENITAGAAEKAAGRNIVGGVENIGKGIKASGLGLAQGANAPGISRIGAAESDKLVNTVIKDFKIKPGSPEAVQRALEKGLAKKTEELTALYANNNVKLAPKELKAIGDKIIQRASTEGGLDKATVTYAKDQVARMYNNKDVSSLWDFTKSIENHLNFARQQNAAEPIKESVGQIIRKEIRSVLDSKVPGLKDANALYHNGSKANALLTKATTNSTGGGITGKVFSLAPVKSAEAKIGSAVEGVGRLMAGTGGPISAVTNQAIRQSPASLGRVIGGAGQMQPDQSQFDPNIMQTSPDLAMTDMAGMGGQAPMQDYSQQAPKQSAYSLEQAIADMQAHPDTKSRKNIMDYYDFVSKAEAAQAKTGGGQKYNSTAAGVIADTTTGLQALQNLRETIASSNVNNPIVGQIRGLNPFDTKAQNLQSQIGVVKQIVGKALEGGVLRKEDEVKYAKILPKLGDSDAVAQNKINQLYQLISQRLDLYKSSISGGTDNQLADIISQFNGGQ